MWGTGKRKRVIGTKETDFRAHFGLVLHFQLLKTVELNQALPLKQAPWFNTYTPPEKPPQPRKTCPHRIAFKGLTLRRLDTYPFEKLDLLNRL